MVFEVVILGEYLLWTSKYFWNFLYRITLIGQEGGRREIRKEGMEKEKKEGREDGRKGKREKEEGKKNHACYFIITSELKLDQFRYYYTVLALDKFSFFAFSKLIIKDWRDVLLRILKIKWQALSRQFNSRAIDRFGSFSKCSASPKCLF